MAKRRTGRPSNRTSGKGTARRDLRFERSNPDLSAKFLSAAEYLLTPFQFPAEFRDFLLKHNGGTPDPRLFTWSHPVAGEQEAAVDDLLGIDARPLGDPARSVDCISLALRMRDDLPRYCVPIGFVDRDDVLLLFTHGPR